MNFDDMSLGAGATLYISRFVMSALGFPMLDRCSWGYYWIINDNYRTMAIKTYKLGYNSSQPWTHFSSMELPQEALR